MNRRFLITTLIACMISLGFALAHAAKTLSVEFTYEKPAKSFNLYMDGQIVCTDVTVGTMTCTDITIDYGMHQFTMTAISDGLETLHSAPYMWAYNPVQGPGPTIINFNVTVEDGSVIPLGSVKVN